MNYLKGILVVLGFMVISIIFGVSFAYITGGQLPERNSIGQSKSFEASQDLIWDALMDIESYPLWKPGLKTVEMLGVNDNGMTKWREFYPFGKSITYEITQYIPKSLIEIGVVESKKSAKGLWIYKLSNYQSRGVLQVKRLAIIRNHLERFTRRWIDTKYNEVDYMLMSLDAYLKQLVEDQEEIGELLVPESIQNNESPLN